MESYVGESRGRREWLEGAEREDKDAGSRAKRI
jgi:hypothetical protein